MFITRSVGGTVCTGRPLLQKLMVYTLCLIFPVMSSLAAETHVVSAAELHQRAASATQARQDNLAKIGKFLSLPPVQSALGAVKMDSAQVQKAVPLLSDEELARLAARADAAQADFAAGALSNEHLTYIVIALATAVIILVIVEAK